MMPDVNVSSKEGDVFLRNLLQAMRPRQWAKNAVIYFAFIFTINERWDLSELGDGLELFGITTAALLLFSMSLLNVRSLLESRFDIQFQSRITLPEYPEFITLNPDSNWLTG